MKVALRHGVTMKAEGSQRTEAVPTTRLEIIVVPAPMH